MRKTKLLIAAVMFISFGFIITSCDTNNRNNYDAERNELKAKVDNTIAKIDNRIDFLQNKLDGVTEETSEKINDTIDQLKEKKEDLKDSIDKMNDEADENWSEFKSTVTQKYNDAETWLKNLDVDLNDNADVQPKTKY